MDSKRFTVDRLMERKRGFRARISDDWYVWERGKKFPIAGPFKKRRMASDDAKRRNGEPPSPPDSGVSESTAMESAIMSDTKNETPASESKEVTEKREERTETTTKEEQPAAEESK